MLGKAINIIDNKVEIELTTSIENYKNLINYHVIFEQEGLRIVGDVSNVGLSNATIFLVGEILNNRFLPGVSKKPMLGSSCRYITAEELAIIVGNNTNERTINIGNMPQYNGYKVNIGINDLFSNHFSILGNTGSGKSSSLARIIQNLFIDPNSVPKKANIFVFDAYGEYHNALKNLSDGQNTNFKVYTTKISKFEDVNMELLKIPPWLLDVDDYALLLEATKPSQLPIIEKA